MTPNETMWQLRDEFAVERGADKPGYFGDDPSTFSQGREKKRIKPKRINGRVRIHSKGYNRPSQAAIHKPLPGEMYLKEFLIMEAKRTGLRPNTIYGKIKDARPGYDRLTIRRPVPNCAFVSGWGP